MKSHIIFSLTLAALSLTSTVSDAQEEPLRATRFGIEVDGHSMATEQPGHAGTLPSKPKEIVVVGKKGAGAQQHVPEDKMNANPAAKPMIPLIPAVQKAPRE